MKDKILTELGKVTGEGLQSDIVSLGLVSDIAVNNGKVISRSLCLRVLAGNSRQFEKAQKRQSCLLMVWTAF